jgi:hypothetical protein
MRGGDMSAQHHNLETPPMGQLCNWLNSRGVAWRFEPLDTTTLLHLSKGDRRTTIDPRRMGQGEDIYTLVGHFAST